MKNVAVNRGLTGLRVEDVIVRFGYDCANSREIRGNRLTARSVSRERGQSGERPEAGVSMRMEDITVLGDTVEVRRHLFKAEDKLLYLYLKTQP